MTHLNHRAETIVLGLGHTSVKHNIWRQRESFARQLSTQPHSGFVHYVVRKKNEVERKTSLKKGYCSTSRKYFKRETKNLKPVPLLELQHWFEPPAPSCNSPKCLFSCCYCSACPKGEETIGVRRTNGVGFDAGCSFPVWFDKAQGGHICF